MSRIRSIHPGLWTDEAFVTLTAPARLLFIGLWNECDDKGTFEWKPLTLKMRVMPADNVDVVALLAEIEAVGSVARYIVEGKSYGAVRNFRKFQRPKKPNDIHPMPPEIESFVGVSSAPVGDQFGTIGEIAPQMKEEGGRREDVGGEAKASKSRKRSYAFPCPAGVDPIDWDALKANRKAKRAALTEGAYRQITTKLDQWHRDGWPPGPVVAYAAERGWTTVFETDEMKGHGNGKQSSYGKPNGASGKNGDARDGIARALDRRLGLDEPARAVDRGTISEGRGNMALPFARLPPGG